VSKKPVWGFVEAGVAVGFEFGLDAAFEKFEKRAKDYQRSIGVKC
jgi:hypothetical protein